MGWTGMGWGGAVMVVAWVIGMLVLVGAVAVMVVALAEALAVLRRR